uniref:Serum response factor n=1 Tax=Ciona savignyi TaxID=51511 RepID=H2ZB74_CIOSA
MNNLKRSSLAAGLDHEDDHYDTDDSKDSSQDSRSGTPLQKPGKKTRGRVKINMEFIDNKLRRYTTFSKRKSGIMKKAHELATLTGTQVMLLVASETGHVYTFATRKLQPILSSEAGKQLIQTCLNSPDGGETNVQNSQQDEQRMSAQGFEEPELSYVPPDDSKDGLLQKTYHILNAISAQQHDGDHHQQSGSSPNTHANLATMNNELNKQSFAIMPTASSGYDPHSIQFSTPSSVRMLSHNMVTTETSTQASHILARAPDEGRIALINSYNTLQRPAVQPILLASSGSLQLPAGQVAAVFEQNNIRKNHR